MGSEKFSSCGLSPLIHERSNLAFLIHEKILLFFPHYDLHSFVRNCTLSQRRDHCSLIGGNTKCLAFFDITRPGCDYHSANVMATKQKGDQ